eukprot:g2708.t1
MSSAVFPYTATTDVAGLHYVAEVDRCSQALDLRARVTMRQQVRPSDIESGEDEDRYEPEDAPDSDQRGSGGAVESGARVREEAGEETPSPKLFEPVSAPTLRSSLFQKKGNAFARGQRFRAKAAALREVAKIKDKGMPSLALDELTPLKTLPNKRNDVRENQSQRRRARPKRKNRKRANTRSTRALRCLLFGVYDFRKSKGAHDSAAAQRAGATASKLEAGAAAACEGIRSASQMLLRVTSLGPPTAAGAGFYLRTGNSASKKDPADQYGRECLRGRLRGAVHRGQFAALRERRGGAQCGRQYPARTGSLGPRTAGTGRRTSYGPGLVLRTPIDDLRRLRDSRKESQDEKTKGRPTPANGLLRHTCPAYNPPAGRVWTAKRLAFLLYELRKHPGPSGPHVHYSSPAAGISYKRKPQTSAVRDRCGDGAAASSAEGIPRPRCVGRRVPIGAILSGQHGAAEHRRHMAREQKSAALAQESAQLRARLLELERAGKPSNKSSADDHPARCRRRQDKRARVASAWQGKAPEFQSPNSHPDGLTDEQCRQWLADQNADQSNWGATYCQERNADDWWADEDPRWGGAWWENGRNSKQTARPPKERRSSRGSEERARRAVAVSSQERCLVISLRSFLNVNGHGVAQSFPKQQRGKAAKVDAQRGALQLLRSNAPPYAFAHGDKLPTIIVDPLRARAMSRMPHGRARTDFVSPSALMLGLCETGWPDSGPTIALLSCSRGEDPVPGRASSMPLAQSAQKDEAEAEMAADAGDE